ncbi:MAG: hypothetical protein RLZZ488_1990 [Pseudomonadota bacterium]|jgi:hypothetical protein
MSRRSVFRINFFISLAVVVLLVLSAAAWLVSKYPWPVLHADFSQAKESVFLGHWPQPSIEEDKQERKKLRRFPKSEQQRRLGIILRRMDYLNVPIFDLFLDQGIQFLTPEVPVGASPAVPLIWPSLPSKRLFGSAESSLRDVRYIVLPTPFGAQCVEGIHLVAGEEIRVNLPPAKNKRNITFNVLPLAPSNMRAWIGQFSWGRQFNDSEVNKVHSVSIPVNDPAATMLRLSMGSGSVLMTSGSISQWDRVGRLPVQVGESSSLWRTANEKVSVEEESSQEVVAEEGGEESPAMPANTQSAGVKVAENSAPAAIPAQAGSKVATNEKGKKDGSESEKKTTEKKVNPLDELLDPESVKYNSVIDVPGSDSVAVGYNVLFIQLDPALNEAFSNEAQLAELAPRLHSFLQNSLNIPTQIPNVSAAELFQHTIVRQNAELIPVGLPILTKDLLTGSGVFNLYQEFRNYGYKVVSFAPSKALALPEALSRGHEIPRVDGRWLEQNDWKFVARRKELDQQNEPVTGLDAIFKNEQTASVQAISETEFNKMAEMLEGLERSSDAIPDWRANEIAVISDNMLYLPRLVDGFQRWMRENTQTRFLAHVYLNNDDWALRPSFKDFLKVLKYKKLKALAFPAVSDKLARIVMLDRVFGNLIDTLIARRTFHRTAVALILPSNSVGRKEQAGRLLVSVPGLKGRSPAVATNSSFDDSLATVAQIVGVQLNQFDVNGRRIFKGLSLEAVKRQPTPPNPAQIEKASASGKKNELEKPTQERNSQSLQSDSGTQQNSNQLGATVLAEGALPASETAEALGQLQHVSRFRMIVLPRAAGCQPFEWTASSSYFGLVSSQPIVEEPLPRGKVIRVFPCSLRDQVIELSWFQSHLGAQQTSFSAQNVSQWLGGSFRLNSEASSGETRDAPLFLVGPQALALDSLPLRLQKFSPQEIPLVFDVSPNAAAGRETLARVLNLSSQIQSPQMSARTLVYFFREPVRR